ncbi:MAG TPA: DUF2946 domain-containing protein [Bradyrhizobium sp.]|uniref:DUF2946 domain-containing protein n=1 Tax=Bradyrhizobium sp. TaxID=376 RepID=UPI002B8656DB|nr:DUF2946 domain-containing protein [Bradyrhizobium sp.]HLZ04854.1 DUF2946 domain-containing protein [Bradyrhizobium sp.]
MGYSRMRRNYQRFLPIVLIALMVQILAPIGACWAAAVAASDPLSTAEICHDTASTPGQPDGQGSQHHEHDGACAICCLAGVTASIDTPKLEAFAVPYRETARTAWHEQASYVSGSRTGSNAQARAPPLSM